MKTELLNFDTITEYDDMLGVETLHPLVSVINLSKAKPMRICDILRFLCSFSERREEL